MRNIFTKRAILRSITPRNSIQSLKVYLYSSDFIELILYLIGVTVPLILVLSSKVMPTNERPIPYQKLMTSSSIDGIPLLDLRLDQKFVSSTFNDFEVIIVAVLVYFIQLALSVTVGSKGDAHLTSCLHIVASGTNLIVTEIMKKYVGYLRPHFYQRCQFGTTALDCQNDRTEDIMDARKSFPSGHASTSFCTMTLLTLYLLQLYGLSGRMRDYTILVRSDDTYFEFTGKQNFCGDGREGTFRKAMIVDEEKTSDDIIVQYKVKKPTKLRRLISLFCLAPMMFAYLIAGSRVVDNYHHPADVVCGAVLGTCLALYFNGIWFPSHIPVA